MLNHFPVNRLLHMFNSMSQSAKMGRIFFFTHVPSLLFVQISQEIRFSTKPKSMLDSDEALHRTTPSTWGKNLSLTHNVRVEHHLL